MTAVGRAPPFSLAGVLAFAAVVAGLATAFAFAGVLSLAGMNILLAFIGHLPQRDTRLGRNVGGVRLDGIRTAHETCERRARENGFGFHCLFLLVAILIPGWTYEPLEDRPGWLRS